MTNVASFPCDKAIAGSATGRAPCTRNAEPWILATTILASSMVFIDGTVVNVALPALQRALGATLGDAQWIVEAYELMLAAGPRATTSAAVACSRSASPFSLSRRLRAVFPVASGHS